MNSNIEDLKSVVDNLELQIELYRGYIKRAEEDIKGWNERLKQLEAEKVAVQKFNILNA